MPLLTTLFAVNFDYWNLYHKVTFDPLTRLISINAGVTDINVQRDIYSASKEWLKLENNLRFKPPVRATGGDPIPGGSPLGRTFFMINGWRIQLDSSVTIDGNLYSENYPSPFVNAPGVVVVRSKFSNLVDVAQPSLVGLNIPTATQNAAAVWDRLLASHTTAGSAGKVIADTEKKTDDNQALIISR